MSPWSSDPRRIGAQDASEEAVSLTKGADGSPRDPAADLEKGHWRSFPSTARLWSPPLGAEVRRGGRGIKLAAASIVCLALTAGLWYHSTTASGSNDASAGSGDHGTPWRKFGDAQVVALGAKEGKLPICERTMLVDWRSFQFGWGSTATTIGIVAHMHGYTMLFDRGANKYGRYLDLFEPAKLDCHAPEELYDPAYYRRGDGTTANVGSVINDQFDRPAIDRLLLFRSIHPLNHHITALVYPDMSYLDSLPTLDASRPVPISSNVPSVFRESFDRYSALTAEHFQLNALLRVKLNAELARLELDGNREASRATIGVHWRGGDKLERECVGSSQLSCGNITHHCATAWDSLRSIRLAPIPSTSDMSKNPRLLLMTTEPNALELFRADPECHKFDVQLLEDSKDRHSFVQDEWNNLSDSERAQDVQSLFVSSEILANHVDAAIVSPNSNLARLIMTSAGPTRVTKRGSVRSVDIYWHPVHYPPFKRSGNWGGCDGTWGGCWPHD
ncbi:uncharacterized protein JCM15063_003826 [Sporobolomyces koalae]|uniref:uncharacterized protein n=1 Tax=Sporobolomyces koalae TaxID=500713 RepID=UPI0031749E12